MRLYYLIWVDCITKARSTPGNEMRWPFLTMIMMSTAMIFNLAFSLSVLQTYFLQDYSTKIDFPELSTWGDNAVSFAIVFVLPCFAINYLFIFRNARYEKLLKKYPYNGGNLFLTYFLLSVFVPVAVVLIGAFF
jgi:hypothetical protein